MYLTWIFIFGCLGVSSYHVPSTHPHKTMNAPGASLLPHSYGCVRTSSSHISSNTDDVSRSPTFRHLKPPRKSIILTMLAPIQDPIWDIGDDVEGLVPDESSQLIIETNHKKEIPEHIRGCDCRPINPKKKNKEHNFIKHLYKLDIIHKLESNQNTIYKLDVIKREHLEIFGHSEIQGVCFTKLFAGFEEFCD